MTDIEAAARATRRYIVDTDSDGTFYISGPKGDIPGSFDEYPEAQAACDRMNLQAVLEEWYSARWARLKKPKPPATA